MAFTRANAAQNLASRLHQSFILDRTFGFFALSVAEQQSFDPAQRYEKMADAPPMRAKRPVREINAAYAASQPLFDALRKGGSRSDQSKIHLAKARDTVQKLHVKLVDTNKADDAAKHEQYVHCIVKAWTNATEIYCEIFDELCNISAADPAQGREAGARHEQFKAMAETAAAARKVAQSFREGESASTPATKQTKIAAPKSLKRDREHSAVETAAEPKEAMSREERRRKRQKKRPDAAPAADEMAASAEPTANMKATRIAKEADERLPTQSETQSAAGKESAVEYEDVSAEVAARLAAKEEKRKAKQAEKKRKRDSGDSALTETVLTGKPNRKKLKVQETGEGIDESSGAMKRKSNGVDARGGDLTEEEPKKRRKKSKA